MKQPFWKKILSYFKDVHIESMSSIFNDDITVLLVKGEYQLVTPEAIYSYGKRYDNFFQAFKKINLDKHDIDTVLLLGLGLGSIPYMLEKFYHKTFTYTAVEIDESIIQLASKYVLNSLQSDITTVSADALAFMAMNNQKYDMIAMDVFVSDFIPPEFETMDFLQNLKESLSEDGLLLFNRLYFFDKDKKNTEIYYKDIFKQVFPDARYFDINGNWILLNR